MKDWKIQPLGEQLCIVTSPRHGFGTDACLLAHFTAPKHKDRSATYARLRGGSPADGAVLCPAQTVGVEISPEGARQYQAAIDRCRLEERHQSYLGDLRSLPKSMWEQFDVVSCNPPYFSAGTGETSQIPEHRLPGHEEGCTLEEVCSGGRPAFAVRRTVLPLPAAPAVGRGVCRDEQGRVGAKTAAAGEQAVGHRSLAGLGGREKRGVAGAYGASPVGII